MGEGKKIMLLRLAPGELPLLVPFSFLSNFSPLVRTAGLTAVMPLFTNKTRAAWPAPGQDLPCTILSRGSTHVMHGGSLIAKAEPVLSFSAEPKRVVLLSRTLARQELDCGALQPNVPPLISLLCNASLFHHSDYS